MRWNCMSKALRFLQITAKYQDCPFSIVFLTIKTSSQNISITLLPISLKLHKHRDRYWRKKLPWTILREQFPVPINTSASKIGNSVISSLLWQLRCHCNPDYNKFSSLSNITVVAIFPNLCLWRRSLCSNLGGIDPKKLFRATLIVIVWVVKDIEKLKLIANSDSHLTLDLHTAENTNELQKPWTKILLVMNVGSLEKRSNQLK